MKRHPIVRFWKYVDVCYNTPCWMWTGAKQKEGYGVISIDYKKVRANRFSYEHFIEKIPLGMEVCHKCDNPSCVNPRHLYLDTHQGNMHDCYNKGRMRDIRPKVTPDILKKIREMYKYHDKELCTIALSKKFGLSYGCVYGIISGRTWKNIV